MLLNQFFAKKTLLLVIVARITHADKISDKATSMPVNPMIESILPSPLASDALASLMSLSSSSEMPAYVASPSPAPANARLMPISSSF